MGLGRWACYGACWMSPSLMVGEVRRYERSYESPDHCARALQAARHNGLLTPIVKTRSQPNREPALFPESDSCLPRAACPNQ